LAWSEIEEDYSGKEINLLELVRRKWKESEKHWKIVEGGS
jgi:hypothetical protein